MKPATLPRQETTGSKEEIKPEERIKELALRRDKAISAGDLNVAIESAGEIARLGGVDEFEAKATLLHELETSAVSSVPMKNIAGSLLDVLRQSVASGHSEIASDRLDQLVRVARKSGDSELIRQSTLFVLSTQQKTPP